jgi:hypothetical protein
MGANNKTFLFLSISIVLSEVCEPILNLAIKKNRCLALLFDQYWLEYPYSRVKGLIKNNFK